MKITKAFILFTSLASSAFGATINVSQFSNTGVATSTGIALNNTYTAYVGTFTGVANATSSFADISANFSVLSSVAFATGAAAGYNGYFATGNINFTDAAGFAGDPLFVFYTNGSTQNALISGFSPLIPADASIPNTANYSVTSSNVGSLTIHTGTYNPLGVNGAGAGGNIQLNLIPEPSAALLGALGALSLLRRKRN